MQNETNQLAFSWFRILHSSFCNPYSLFPHRRQNRAKGGLLAPQARQLRRASAARALCRKTSSNTTATITTSRMKRGSIVIHPSLRGVSRARRGAGGPESNHLWRRRNHRRPRP
jgi:hypothetical protein